MDVDDASEDLERNSNYEESNYVKAFCVYGERLSARRRGGNPPTRTPAHDARSDCSTAHHVASCGRDQARSRVGCDRTHVECVCCATTARPCSSAAAHAIAAPYTGLRAGVKQSASCVVLAAAASSGSVGESSNARTRRCDLCTHGSVLQACPAVDAMRRGDRSSCKN